jgi:hypothetical protein
MTDSLGGLAGVGVSEFGYSGGVLRGCLTEKIAGKNRRTLSHEENCLLEMGVFAKFYSVSAYILAEANIIDKTNGASASAGFELLQSDLELTTKAPPHPRALVRFLWPLLLISVCTYIGPDVLYLLRGQRALP